MTIFSLLLIMPTVRAQEAAGTKQRVAHMKAQAKQVRDLRDSVKMVNHKWDSIAYIIKERY